MHLIKLRRCVTPETTYSSQFSFDDRAQLAPEDPGVTALSHQVWVRNLVRKSRPQLNLQLSVDLFASRRGGTQTVATQCMVHDPPLDGDLRMSTDSVQGESGRAFRIASATCSSLGHSQADQMLHR